MGFDCIVFINFLFIKFNNDAAALTLFVDLLQICAQILSGLGREQPAEPFIAPG